MSTKLHKKEINRRVHLFDAKGKVLGRLAGEIALVLSGKRKRDYVPHIDAGDTVVVINAEKVAFTGRKGEQKVYHRFSGYPGGLKSVKLKDQLRKDARKVIRVAVAGMLAKNKLRDRMLTRLHIYNDAEHPHTNIEITHQ
ncbi:MAG TPA: 50S ribosomal protein L13 [Candidatus Moranbacteria bacterium]|nr:50S ribosomal protein L13 [Candidatus Moranbacteria bacterium]